LKRLFSGVREGVVLFTETKTLFRDAVNEFQAVAQLLLSSFAPKGPSDQTTLFSMGFSSEKH
jgi:hypothetical protein